MLGGDWRTHFAIRGIAIAALVLLFPVAWLYNYSEKHAQERQAAASKQLKGSDQKRPASCIDVATSKSFPCFVDVTQSEPSEDYTAYDLKAQQDMAEWAFAMFVASALGVVITGAATYWVAMTLHETRRLVNEAEKTTKAAEETTKTTREIGEAQVRAYVAPLIPGIAFDESLRPNFRVRLANTGNSPALWFSAECQIVFSPQNIDGCAECRPASIFVGSISAGETTQDINFVCEAPLSVHQSSDNTVMHIRVLVDLEWQSVFNNDDGSSCSYSIFIDRPLSDQRMVSIIPEGMTLGRRMRCRPNKFVGATSFNGMAEQQGQQVT